MADKQIPEILADLPENWGYGQTVSPEGVEVGLTPQHGYNYLMRKVNAAVRAINEIVVEMGQLVPEDMVKAKGGAELILPDILGGGPYVIEFTEEAAGDYATKDDLKKYALITDLSKYIHLVESANKLQNKRAVQTNLDSNLPAYFDGSADIYPGVTGVLPVLNGGTGVSSLDALRDLLGIGSGGDTAGSIYTETKTIDFGGSETKTTILGGPGKYAPICALKLKFIPGSEKNITCSANIGNTILVPSTDLGNVAVSSYIFPLYFSFTASTDGYRLMGGTTTGSTTLTLKSTGGKGSCEVSYTMLGPLV